MFLFGLEIVQSIDCYSNSNSNQDSSLYLNMFPLQHHNIIRTRNNIKSNQFKSNRMK